MAWCTMGIVGEGSMRGGNCGTRGDFTENGLTSVLHYSSSTASREK